MLDKSTMVKADQALPGRADKMPLENRHFVSGHAMTGDLPSNLEQAVFGLGCFWGAERCFWQQAGVYSTAVGYAAGFTPNPSYEEVCSGLTGHNEVVLVIFDPSLVSYEFLLALFWSSHNPTQGMAQGNDRGTQYRSGIYTYSESQRELAEQSLVHYQQQLSTANYSAAITTEIVALDTFYFAEGYHQQYLAKNPGGYCGLGGLNIAY